MREPGLEIDESQRLEKLDSLRIVYSPADHRFDRITKMAQQMFDVPIALVSLVTKDKQWFKSAQGLCAAETPREISFCGHAILANETFVVNNALEHPDFSDNPLVTDSPNIRFYAGHPISYKGSNMGTLCLIDTKPRDFSAEQIESLQTLAQFVENELEVCALSESQAELLADLKESRREAMIDPLTGLWNRRGVDELLPRELARAHRQGSSVALMLLDVDYFKPINDRFGHDAGDEVLKEVASRLRGALRPHDVACRYGDDEFLVFLGNCSQEGAQAVARRILDRVRVEPVKLASGETEVTVSVGVASAGDISPELLPELVKTADMALYDAKARGRDCSAQLTLDPARTNAA